MIHLYDYLYRHQKNRNLALSDDGAYYLAHRNELLDRPLFSTFHDADNEFDIIRANILLYSLKTIRSLSQILRQFGISENNVPAHLDSNVQVALKEVLDESPSFLIDGEKAYFPLFSRVFNLLTIMDALLAFRFPMDRLVEQLDGEMVDPFEEYNFALFGSPFTSLIEVGGDATSRAYYHVDFQMIFIINRQGSLDNLITLFDSKIKKINTINIVSRIKPVVQAYYAGNRIRMIEMLYTNDLISLVAYNQLLGKVI